MQTSAQRLADYRAAADTFKQKQPTFFHYHDWRAHRKNLTPERYGFGADGMTMWLDSHDDAPGLRIHKETHEVVRLGRTGWFADYIEHETISGTVSVMRFGRFVYIVAGVTYSQSDTDELFWDTLEKIPANEAWDGRGDITEALDDAMRDIASQADRIAERRAEEAREDDLKYIADQAIEELREEIEELRKSTKTLIKEIKAYLKADPLGFPAAICETLRGSIKSNIMQVQTQRRRIKDITQNPYILLG